MPDQLIGTYKISSVVIKGGAATGVGLRKPPFQPVRIDADVRVWTIWPNENGSYKLSLKDKYPYTGALDDKQVIATIEEKDNREWRIVPHAEHDAYAIELNTGFWPTPGWTLSGREPGADIVLSLIVTRPTEDQLFKLERVDIEE